MTLPPRRTMLIAGLAAVVLFAGGVMTGRLTKKPVEIVRTVETRAESQIVYASHAAEQRTDKGRTHTVRVREQKPDGSVLTTTTVDHAADLTLNLDWLTNATASATSQTKETVTTRDLRSNWRLGVGALWAVDRFTPAPHAYALSLDRRVLGPVSAGLRGSYVPSAPRESAVGAGLSVEW